MPGWCSAPALSVNGRNRSPLNVQQGYLILKDKWKSGDNIKLTFPMPVQLIAANPNVKANHGLSAIQRGPIVYCLEQRDQSDPIPSLFLPLNASLKAERETSRLGNMTVIRGIAGMPVELNWHRTLYQSVTPSQSIHFKPFKAIPYYAWANRQAGTMKVWLPTAPPVPRVGGLEAQAKVSMSFVSDNCQPQAVNDGVEPKSSGEQPAANCHWWPHKGTGEWVQYTWPNRERVAGARVYWFDDTGRGNCRVPAAWEVQYLAGSDWKSVKANDGYPVAKDKWCDVQFEPVQTTALRLAVTLEDGWSAGVHEWKVIETDD
jgi:hypothetical protein